MEVLAVIVGVSILLWTFSVLAASKLKVTAIEREVTLARKRIQELEKFLQTRAQAANEAIASMAKEKSLGFPWLAEAYADFFHLQDLQTAEYLENKDYPAK